MDYWEGMTGLPYGNEVCPLTGIELEQQFNIRDVKKCECGMDFVYGPDNEVHSDYCPLYKDRYVD